MADPASAPGRSLAWLRTWIADQLGTGAGREARPPDVTGAAMYVYGSIGVEAALTTSAEVWVAEYDFDTVEGTDAALTWHRAEDVERLGILVIASRRFTALRALLPDRPPAVADCRACRGTGSWHIFSADRKESLGIPGMICRDCGGMGWRVPADVV